MRKTKLKEKVPEEDWLNYNITVMVKWFDQVTIEMFVQHLPSSYFYLAIVCECWENVKVDKIKGRQNHICTKCITIVLLGALTKLSIRYFNIKWFSWSKRGLLLWKLSSKFFNWESFFVQPKFQNHSSFNQLLFSS